MNNLGFGMLATLLVLIGATIGAVLTYLANRSRHTSRLTLELIRRNEHCSFDALNFLSAAWPILAEAGFNGLSWQADWYGGSKHGSDGTTRGIAVRRTLEASEIKIAVDLILPAVRGEDRYFREALAATFFLLLQCDLWVKAGSVNAAAAELSRFALFLRHDMKNYAQYIELLDDQVRACPPEHAAALLERLQRTTPILRDRAAAMLHALQGDKPASTPSEALLLQPIIVETAALHGLSCTVEYSGYTTTMPVAILDSTLDNLFKNYADLAQRNKSTMPSLLINMDSCGDYVTISIEDPQAKPVSHLERFFEPFWSDHTNGLGIGLYQARQAVLNNNGTLSVECGRHGGPRFILKLPTRKSV